MTRFLFDIRQFCAAAALLLLATPACAITTEDILNIAAGLVLFKEECGPFTPKMQELADLLGKVPSTGVNPLEVLSATFNVRWAFKVEGKEAWCARVRAGLE
jgi:hypothetical protein